MALNCDILGPRNNLKRCPYCDEEVRDNAVKCKHCGSMLDSGGKDTLDRVVTIGSGQSLLQYDTLDSATTADGKAIILANQYRIIKKIGEGGMGVVYLAEDLEMNNRPVAIKVLPPLLAKNTRAVENLRKEAITAINLNHPNIIRLYGFHSDGEIKFLVMEYIDGQTLEEKIANSATGKLNLEETINIAEKVAAALDYAHTRKPPVFHRDLKPANIMIGKDGEVKLLDFGIAREIHDSYTRVTGKQDTSGTLPYMSPEQVRGHRPTAAMDIYSLGVVCYECLNGKPPFSTGQIEYQIIHEKPAPIKDVTDYINDALQQVLAKEVERRPKNAVGIVNLLRGKDVVEFGKHMSINLPIMQVVNKKRRRVIEIVRDYMKRIIKIIMIFYRYFVNKKPIIIQLGRVLRDRFVCVLRRKGTWCWNQLKVFWCICRKWMKRTIDTSKLIGVKLWAIGFSGAVIVKRKVLVICRIALRAVILFCTFWQNLIIDIYIVLIKRKPNYITVLFLQIFGLGFFYVRSNTWRQYLYPLFPMYAITDIFLAMYDVEPFDSTNFGATTFYISLLLIGIGLIDISVICHKMRRSNFNQEQVKSEKLEDSSIVLNKDTKDKLRN